MENQPYAARIAGVRKRKGSGMKRFGMALAAAVALAGCGGTFATSYDNPVAAEVSRGWRVSGVSVSVPDRLSTTEANVLAPNADIVWHGEPKGNRRAQVARIVEEGLKKGGTGLRGRSGVVLQAQLIHFHGVTPIAVNEAPAAVHNISYILQVVDRATGKVVAGPEVIQADLPAFTKSAAVVASTSGITERQRIVDHIAEATAGWLGTGPDPRETFSSLGR